MSVQNIYLTGSSVSCFTTNSSCYFLKFYTRHFWWLAVLVRNSLLFLVLLCDLSCSVYSQSYWWVRYNEPSNHEILIWHARNSIRCQSVSRKVRFTIIVLVPNFFFFLLCRSHFTDISSLTQLKVTPCLQNFYECDIWMFMFNTLSLLSDSGGFFFL